MVFSVFSGGIEKKERKCLSVALCKKIWTLPLESGILGFGICITIEIRNPSSIEKESVIQYLESRIPNPRFWQARLPQFGGGWGECGLIFRIVACNRAFHLSELTGRTIPVSMTISLLIKTLQPDQSNPE